jgi:hypothetical protein
MDEQAPLIPVEGQAGGDGHGGLLTSGQLAAALGLSAQTVRNDHGDGMPAAGRALNAGRAVPLFDLAAAREWRRRNRSTGDTQGGKRPRAGRPRGSGKRQNRRAPLEMALEEAGDEKRALARELAEIRRRALEGRASREEIERILLVDEELGGLTRAEADRHKVLLETQRMRHDLEERAGRVVNAEEVQRTWNAGLDQIATELRHIPPLAAGEVLATLGLEAGKLLLAQAAIERVVEQAMSRLGLKGFAGFAAAQVA